MTAVGAPDLASPPGPAAHRRFYGWRIVTVLAVTETVSWGVLYYAFAVFQVSMRAELGFSTAQTAGAFSLAVLMTGLAAVPVGRWLDRHGGRGLMTVGSVAAVRALSVTGRLAVTGATRHFPTASVTAVAFAVQAVAVVVLLAAGSSAAGAVAFVLLFELGFGVGTIARPALLADAFGTASYATLSALGGVAFTAAKTVGPFAAGVALTTSGSWTPVLLGLLAVTAVASAAVARAGHLLASARPAQTGRG